jgi:anti-anti-sigma factor
VLGPLDAYTSPELGARLFELEQWENQRIEVDLSRTSDMDSTGIRVILASFKRMRNKDRTVWIVGASKPVKRILGALGMQNCVSL